jgi:hypothetical protein
VIDGSALQLFFVVLTSWLERRERCTVHNFKVGLRRALILT